MAPCKLLLRKCAVARRWSSAGTNPARYGYEEGWVAVIPEPSTLILAAFAACIIGSRRSRNLR